jgi:uracil-DNA glycosylase
LRYHSVAELNLDVVSCEKCPRLVDFRSTVPARAAFRGQDYWGEPVPGFGDTVARVVVVGLAPAAQGGNRTGRVFTGDESAKFLLRSLQDAGLANNRPPFLGTMASSSRTAT